MDSAHASPQLEVTLAPLELPCVAIDPCFYEPRVVSLHEYPHLFRSRHTVQDVHTGATRFVIKSKFLARRYWLFDANKVPVANYTGTMIQSQITQNVRARSDVNGKELFQIYSQAYCRSGGLAHTLFTDLVTGQPCEIALEGDWYRRNAYFWLDRGRRGVREPVVKIYCLPRVPRATITELASRRIWT